jgi:hypothetical protein
MNQNKIEISSEKESTLRVYDLLFSAAQFYFLMCARQNLKIYQDNHHVIFSGAGGESSESSQSVNSIDSLVNLT